MKGNKKQTLRESFWDNGGIWVVGIVSCFALYFGGVMVFLIPWGLLMCVLTFFQILDLFKRGLDLGRDNDGPGASGDGGF